MFETILALLAVVAGFGLLLGISHTLTLNWNRNSDQIAVNVTITDDAEQNFDVTVPGSSNVVVGCEIDVSALKLLYIYSDQTVTITTNDDGTPDDTLTITALKPLIWYTGCGLPNPFASAVDVESFKATRGSAGDAALKVRVIQDPTP